MPERMEIILRNKSIAALKAALAKARTIPDTPNNLSNVEDVLMCATEIQGIRKTLGEWIKEYKKDGKYPKTVGILSAFDHYLNELEREWSRY